MRMRTLFVVVVVLVLVAAACAADEPTATTLVDETTLPAPMTTAPAPSTTVPTTTTSTAPTAVDPTTTVPIDVTPPFLEVTLPLYNEHVSDRWCPFEGTAEPGVELLAAGRYPIGIASDGTWSTVLRLNPGGNVATFTAVDEAGNATEVRVPVFYDPPVVLRADGLGEFDFSEEMDTVMAGLTDLLGPPTSDRVMTPDDFPPDYESGVLFGIVAYPAIEYFRSVHWTPLGLEAMFSDYEPAAEQWSAGPIVLNGWIVSDPGEFGSYLSTSAGASVGTALAQLDAMYGAALEWYPEVDELTGDWHFRIDSGLAGWHDGETLHWYGRFDGDPTQPPTYVTSLQAGYGYDEC